MCINEYGDKQYYNLKEINFEKCYFKVCSFFNPPKVI